MTDLDPPTALPQNVIVDVPIIPTTMGRSKWVWLNGRSPYFNFVEATASFTVGNVNFPSSSTDDTNFVQPGIAYFPMVPSSTPPAPDTSVIWITKPGVYTISLTMGWTMPEVFVSNTPTPSTEDLYPYKLETMLITALGLRDTINDASGPTFVTDETTIAASVASKYNITPYIIDNGSSTSYEDNFITQTLSTTTLVPRNQFLAMRIQTIASSTFNTIPNPPTPNPITAIAVIYKMRITSQDDL
jgi:hypothetical protein